jgi:hypothetical protein
MSSTDQSSTRRLIGAILLVVLVFLPLHYHAFTPTSQLAKECSCVHGTRTQLALHADAPDVTPTLQVIIFAAHYQFSWAGSWSELPSVRGPPTALSV